MAAQKRTIAILLLLAIFATWVPPAAAQTFTAGGPAQTVGTFPPPLPIIPIRHPHESVAANTARDNWNYLLKIKGSGLPIIEIPFHVISAREVCVFYENAGPGFVRARVYAMSGGQQFLGVGQAIKAWVPTTLDTVTEERGWWKGGLLNTGWRTTPIPSPRDGNASCLTTVGWTDKNAIQDNTWLAQAVRATNYALTRSMMDIGVAYFTARWESSRLNAQHNKVNRERRPSLVWVHYNQTAPVKERFSLDAVQEPQVFLGTPPVWLPAGGGLMYPDVMPYEEQVIRWRSYMLSEAASGGYLEGYVISGVTEKDTAMSGARALTEAEARNERIVELTHPSHDTRLSATTDPATLALIRQALAAPGGHVKVTVSPTTASNGWRGTPWLAWSSTGPSSPVNVGTYLGVLRGASGEAGANPKGTAHADAQAQSTALGKAGIALGLVAVVLALTPLGLVGKAITHSFAVMGAVAGIIAGALSIAATEPPGKVGVNPTPPEDPLPEGKITIGPITGTVIGEEGSGVGADGTSGPGGCGCGPGDPGNGLGGEI